MSLRRRCRSLRAGRGLVSAVRRYSCGRWRCLGRWRNGRCRNCHGWRRRTRWRRRRRRCGKHFGRYIPSTRRTRRRSSARGLRCSARDVVLRCVPSCWRRTALVGSGSRRGRARSRRNRRWLRGHDAAADCRSTGGCRSSRRGDRRGARRCACTLCDRHAERLGRSGCRLSRSRLSRGRLNRGRRLGRCCLTLCDRHCPCTGSSHAREYCALLQTSQLWMRRRRRRIRSDRRRAGWRARRFVLRREINGRKFRRHRNRSLCRCIAIATRRLRPAMEHTCDGGRRRRDWPAVLGRSHGIRWLHQ